MLGGSILAKLAKQGSIGGEPQCRVRRSLVGFSEGDTVSGLEPLLVAAPKSFGAGWGNRPTHLFLRCRDQGQSWGVGELGPVVSRPAHPWFAHRRDQAGSSVTPSPYTYCPRMYDLVIF